MNGEHQRQQDFSAEGSQLPDRNKFPQTNSQQQLTQDLPFMSQPQHQPRHHSTPNHYNNHWMDPSNGGSTTANADPDYNAMPVPSSFYQYTIGPRTSQQQQQQPMAPTVNPQMWPSMIASQQYYNTPYAYTQQAAALGMTGSGSGTPQIPAAMPTAPHHPTPRRTLTDADRRRMCEYHAKNPTKKQTEIGEVFGVERSTVSKVLRQKEKYLNQEETSRSPTRKPKPKYPDIDRTLATWVKKKIIDSGRPVTDEELMKQADMFWLAGGHHAEVKEVISSPDWLDSFKAKYALVGSTTTPFKSPPNNRKRSPTNRNEAADGGPPKRGRTPSVQLGDSDHSPGDRSNMQRTQSSSSLTSTHRGIAGGEGPFSFRSHESLRSAFAEAPIPEDAIATDDTTSPLLSPSINGSNQTRTSYFANMATTMNAVHRGRSQTFPHAPVDPYMSPPPNLRNPSSSNPPSASTANISATTPSYRATPSNDNHTLVGHPYPYSQQPHQAEQFDGQHMLQGASGFPQEDKSSPASSLPTPLTPSQRTPSFDDAQRGMTTVLSYLQRMQAVGSSDLVDPSELDTLRRLHDRWQVSGLPHMRPRGIPAELISPEAASQWANSLAMSDQSGHANVGWAGHGMHHPM